MGDHALPPGDWHEGDHVPHVVSWQFLLGILISLLALTVLTVAAARVDLGSGLNIGIALAIATVKATLVAAFFMHLYWDKPINTVVLLFSLSLLALFLGFSLLDGMQYQESVIPDYAYNKMKEQGWDPAEMVHEAHAGHGGGESHGGESGGGESHGGESGGGGH
ncbi:MAG: cytochrome C oxidase subunit IV family protein [Planctomycetota bacterium]